MATYEPARSFYQIPATSWAWWMDDSGVGDTLEHNSDKLILSSDATTRTLKAAIKFHIPASAPDWVTLGPITAFGMGFGSVITGMASSSKAAHGITARLIEDAWDETSDITAMRGLAVSASYSNFTYLVFGAEGAQCQWGGTVLAVGANGIMLDLVPTVANTFKSIVLATDPVPVLRFYFQYSDYDTVHAEATTRATYSTAVKAALAGSTPHRRISIAIAGKRTDREPAETDAVFRTLSNSALAVQRSVSFPEVWSASLASTGALSVSMEDYLQFASAQDSPLETTVSIEDTDGLVTPVAKFQQLVGDMSKMAGPEGEVGLSSLTQSMMARRITRTEITDQYSYLGVSYDDEHPLFILDSLLLNCSLVNFKNLYFNDIVALTTRFQRLWGNLTYTYADFVNTTVGTFWNLFAPMFGLWTSEMGDGCWAMFHPAVYRPSMRVFILTRHVRNTFKVSKPSRVGAYNTVAVKDDRSTGALTSTVEENQRLPICSEYKESIYSFTATGAIFRDAGVSSGDDLPIARLALATQLSQVLCGEYRLVEGSVGVAGVDLNCGDIVVVTPPKETLPILAVVIRASLVTGTSFQTQYQAVSFTKYMGLNSVFQLDGILGLWRFDGATGIEHPERGTDDHLTYLSGGDYPAKLQAHWQNHLLGGFTLYHATSLLTNTAGYSDTFDLAMAGLWKLDYDDDHRQPSWFNTTALASFVPILTWRRASGDIAVSVGVVRSSSGRDIGYNKLAIRCWKVLNSTKNSIDVTYYAPPGLLGTNDESVVEEALLAVSIAVEWQDTTIRVLLNRMIVLEATDATYFGKADQSAIFIHSSHGGPYPNDTGTGTVAGITQTMIATFTHIGQAGWITNVQRLNGKNGIDPFYGPDDITTVVST